MHIVLYEPEILSNTGNIGRSYAVTGSSLHLIEPLGFNTDDKSSKRAGLDYWKDINVYYYKNFKEFLEKNPQANCYFLSTKGEHLYSDIAYKEEDFLVFGPETRGLPETLLERYQEQVVKIPMGENLRSLNLSNAVAIVLYESLRQNSFKGLK